MRLSDFLNESVYALDLRNACHHVTTANAIAIMVVVQSPAMIWGFISNFQSRTPKWEAEDEGRMRYKHPTKLSELFHGASGDFLMASRDAWHAVRGYPEWCMNVYLDSVGMCQLAKLNLTQVCFSLSRALTD
jgi:hypothetical protein